MAMQNDKSPNASQNIIERLFADKTWTASYRVSQEEIDSLSNVAMMGEVQSERDVLFILNQIRRARLRW
ncbi:MAG TPA: hypothetical protein VN867_10625 [Candidatus Binataceae bacterium]|nr:hypothetical protein [Candidatus Binataceae bacterium]